MNEEVNKYLEKQKSLQKEICTLLRGIIFRTLPGIEEEMKWGVPTYAQGKYYLVGLEDHVNLGFSMKGLSKVEQRHFRGSGKTMKTIEIRPVEEIDENRIVELLKLVWEKQ